MTDREAFSHIIKLWQAENTVSRIMVTLICLGKPYSRAKILAVVRRYVDTQSENVLYRARQR